MLVCDVYLKIVLFKGIFTGLSEVFTLFLTFKKEVDGEVILF